MATPTERCATLLPDPRCLSNQRDIKTGCKLISYKGREGETRKSDSSHDCKIPVGIVPSSLYRKFKL